MTLKVSACRDNYVERDPRRSRWDFSGDIQAEVRATTIMDFYHCKQLAGLRNIRNLTIEVKSLHLGYEAWLTFFTFFAQTACRLKRFRILLDSSLRRSLSLDNWWLRDIDKVATALSPLRACLRYGRLFYLEGFSPDGDMAVKKRLGLRSVDKSGLTLFKVWNVMLGRYENIPRQCLSSE